jgi:predicted transcriptional regulator
MDIQLEKIELMKKLLETNDETIIKSIKNIFSAKKKDWWDELSKEQKEEIEIGEKQIAKGEFVDFEEFIDKYIK